MELDSEDRGLVEAKTVNWLVDIPAGIGIEVAIATVTADQNRDIGLEEGRRGTLRAGANVYDGRWAGGAMLVGRGWASGRGEGREDGEVRGVKTLICYMPSMRFSKLRINTVRYIIIDG
ncbi:hypothetical protein EVAR_98383_1 [Eumeta japonica]|uniref:Uncharacterized protein n=1 Tax=Eumeta variegata TaxID=151549 RepID=A0A4C1XR81_EUMVA|nr:hypothetical protein EVAR_98383_1 [Eumeta japonica]